jgi:ubiquinone/menaquinone biosynthesis C-methylase UbiE
VSGRKGAYNYFGKSVVNFPSGKEIKKILLSSGFREVSFKHMNFGIVGLHVGIK